MTYYYYSLTDGSYNTQSETSLLPYSGYGETTIAPNDFNMLWNLVSSGWYYTKTSLKNQASNYMNDPTLSVSLLGNTIPVFNLQYSPWTEIFAEAIRENKANTRTIVMADGSYVTATNAQVVALFMAYSNLRQKLQDVYKIVADQVEAGTLTTFAQIDTAWDTAFAAYVNMRNVAPDNEDLYILINGLSGSVHNNAGSTNSGTRAIVTANNAANGFQLSTAKVIAYAKYNITMTISPTLLAAASRTVTAYVAPTNSTTPGDWVKYDAVGVSLPAGVALTNTTATQTLILNDIPVGYWIRLLETSTGTGSSVINSFIEKY